MTLTLIYYYSDGGTTQSYKYFQPLSTSNPYSHLAAPTASDNELTYRPYTCSIADPKQHLFAHGSEDFSEENAQHSCQSDALHKY